MFTMLPAAVGTGNSSGLWTPANLTSLYAWYKADSASNTLSGSTFTTFKDLSGNGRDATFSGSAITKVAAIIGGRDIARSSPSTNGRADIASSTAFLNGKSGATLGVMTTPTYTGASLGHILATETPAPGFARFYLRYPGPTAQRPSILGRRLDADSLQTVTTPANVTGATSLIAIVNYASATAEIRGNGSSLVSTAFQTAGTTSATNSNVATALFCQNSGSNSYGGDVGEVVICDAALSSTDAQKLEGYLAWQWGQQGSLPVGHPYKSAPPTI